MQAIKFPIAVTSSVLFVYAVFSLLNVSYPLIVTLFLTVNVLFVWMVLRILKDGTPSEKSFDDYFYEDFPEKRN